MFEMMGVVEFEKQRQLYNLTLYLGIIFRVLKIRGFFVTRTSKKMLLNLGWWERVDGSS